MMPNQEYEVLALLWERSRQNRNTPVHTEGINTAALVSLIESGMLIEQSDGTVRVTEDGEVAIAHLVHQDSGSPASTPAL